MDMDIKGNNLEKPTGKLYYLDYCGETSIIKNYENEETIRDILERLTKDHRPGEIISEYLKVNKTDLISGKINTFETTVDPENDETIDYIKYIEDCNKNELKYYVTRVMPISYYISSKNTNYISTLNGYLLEDYLRIQEIDENLEKIAREKYSGDNKKLDKILKINPRSYKFELDSLKKDLAKYYLYTPWQIKKDYFYGYTIIMKSNEKYYIMPEVMEDTGIGRDIKGNYCMYIGEEKDIMGTKVKINTNKLISGFYISSHNREMVERVGNPYSHGYCCDRTVDEPEYIYCLCKIKYENTIDPGNIILRVKELELISPRVGYKRG